ncbi:unnamed protein product, partial [Closterium sp. Naga37s-1]
CDLPLLAVELLCFNASRLLAFIDLHPTSPHQLHRLTQGNLLPPTVTARLNTIRQQHAHLLTPMTARFFATDSHFFSPHLLLYRSQDGWADANLQPTSGSVWQLLNEYITAYHDACMACHGGAAPPTQADCRAAEEGQRAFDEYFEQHDPAVNMLGQLFGEEWTNAYTNRFLFPLAAPHHSTTPPSSSPSVLSVSASPIRPSSSHYP